MATSIAVETPSFAPLYKEVRTLLTQGLAQGEWKPGEPLPSESQLAKRFHVSIGTIRRGIDELVAEQILVRHQGRGTFVAAHTPKRTLYRFFRIVGMDGRKESPEFELLSFARGRADKLEAQRLNVLPGERVIRIVNLQRLGDSPVAVDHIVLSDGRFPGLTENVLREREETLYSFYQSQYGINVVRAHERLRALLCDAGTAGLLGIEPGAAVLEINRIAVSYHNTPVELRRSLVSTAVHEYWNDLGKADTRA